MYRPYTKAAANLEADVFLLLQDWCSADFLSGAVDDDLIRYGRKPNLPTNRNLDRLLENYLGLPIRAIYATNLFAFVKPGGMTVGIPMRDLVSSAEAFALPQIDIVGPRLVIVFGFHCYNALAAVLGGPRARTLDEALQRPIAYRTCTMWCQAHPGGLGQANRRRGGIDRVAGDWQVMAQFLDVTTGLQRRNDQPSGRA